MFLLAAATQARAAAPVPKDVADYLLKVAHFTPDRIAALEAGEPIVKVAADNNGEVSVIGAVRIRTTKEHVQLYFDELIKFEDGVVVLRVGRFTSPPALANVGRLQLEPGDIDALKDCKPGDCDVKVGAGIAELRLAVDFSARDANEQVNAFVRQRLVDYVKKYTEQGDAALVTYNDQSQPLSLAKQWQGLLAGSAYLHDYAPQLARFLRDYPRATLSGSQDFIQWTKADWGMKPVISVSHIVMYKDPAKPDRLSVATKQIYASHFYEGAFSFATAIDAGTPEAPTTYVVFVSRTLTDLLRGALGGMKRKITSGQIMKGAELTLQQMRDGLEKAAGVQ